MKATSAWVCFFVCALASTIAPKAIAEEITVSIYVANELDVCPGGYASNVRCPQFTGAKFDELLRGKKLRRIAQRNVDLQLLTGRPSPIPVALGEARGLVRKYAHAGGAKTVALVVVEYLRSQGPHVVMTPQYQAAESDDDNIITGTINRRSFSHGSVLNLDPERAETWSFSRRGQKLELVFE